MTTKSLIVHLANAIDEKDIPALFDGVANVISVGPADEQTLEAFLHVVRGRKHPAEN